MSTLMELAGKISLDSSAWTAGLQKAAAETEQLARSTGQITVAAQSVAGATSWQELESKLLAVTDASGQAAQGATALGTATAQGATKGAEALGQATKGATALGTATAAGAAKGTTALSGLTSGVRGVESGLRGVNTALQAVLTLGGITTAVAGIAYTLDKVLDFGAAGARLENMEAGFERFVASSGQSADDVLANMQRMSQGMLSEAQLMEQYNRVFLLTGAELAGRMPELIQLATAAAGAGMGEFSYLLNSLVIGIGRLSPMILDNLGLAVSLEQSYARYAATLGISASALTKAQQQQAVLNNVMDQAKVKFGDLGEAAEGMAGVGIARLRAATADYINYLKTEASPAIDDFATRVANMLAGVTGGTERWQESEMARLRLAATGGMTVSGFYKPPDPTAIEAWARGYDVSRFSLDRYIESLRILGEVSPETAAAIGLQAGAFAEAGMAADEYAETYRRLTFVSDDAARAFRLAATELVQTSRHGASADVVMQGLATAAAKAEAEIAALQVRLASLTDKDVTLRVYIQQQIAELGGPAVPLWYQGAGQWQTEAQLPRPGQYTRQQLAELEQRRIIELEKDTAYQIAEIIAGYPEPVQRVNETLYDYHERLADWQISQAQRGASGGASAYKDALKDMEGYTSDYQSAISGILQPPGADLTALEDQMGMHVDTWDENLARAEALVRDTADTMKEPWFPEFMAETGMPPGLSVEQAQAWGLNFMREFGMGMRPEAIKWDAFVAAMDEQLATKLNWQSIMGIGAEQLAAAGLGPENPEVMAAFDFAGAGSTGAGEFAGTFRSTLLAEDWPKAGTDLGKAFVGGFGTALKTPGTAFNTTVRQVCESIFQDWLNRDGVP